MNDIKLQYQLSNGSWVNCKKGDLDRTDEFIGLCVEFNSDINSTDEAIAALLSGRKLRNDRADWYSVCRSEIPVIQERERVEIEQKQAADKKRQELIDKNCDIFLSVPFSKKDLAKSFGAKWNPSYKLWYYPSPAGEYLPEGLLEFDSNKTAGDVNSERFAETGLDWYDR